MGKGEKGGDMVEEWLWKRWKAKRSLRVNPDYWMGIIMTIYGVACIYYSNHPLVTIWGLICVGIGFQDFRICKA